MAIDATFVPFNALDDVRVVADDGVYAHGAEFVGDFALVIADSSIVFVAPVGGNDDAVGIFLGDFNEAFELRIVVAVNNVR